MKSGPLGPEVSHDLGEPPCCNFYLLYVKGKGWARGFIVAAENENDAVKRLRRNYKKLAESIKSEFPGKTDGDSWNKKYIYGERYERAIECIELIDKGCYTASILRNDMAYEVSYFDY